MIYYFSHVKVRNEAAEDFLELVKEWQKLCKRFAVNIVERENKQRSMSQRVTRNSENSPSITRNSVDSPKVTGNSVDSPRVTRSNVNSPRVTRNSVNSPRDVDIPPGEYEVARIVDICYGDPNESGKRGLNFKVLKFFFSSIVSAFFLFLYSSLFVSLPVVQFNCIFNIVVW